MIPSKSDTPAARFLLPLWNPMWVGTHFLGEEILICFVLFISMPFLYRRMDGPLRACPTTFICSWTYFCCLQV